MFRAIFVISILFLGTLQAWAQDPHAFSSTGVARYVQPEEPHYRALFGFGGNDGFNVNTPQTFLGNISYELSPSVLSAGFITSNSVSRQAPRLTYTEFDLMYGIALDRIFSNYEGPSQAFHTSISAGIGVNDYQTRWRYGRRGPQDSLYMLLPPNTSVYSLALPIQLQALYEPFRYVGIGGLLFYTISKLQPSFGGAVVAEIRY